MTAISRPWSDRALTWLASGIVFVMLCFRLGYLPLLAPDEGRNAEVGREMKESGAWLVPTYNGVDYLDKPAFYFKAVALSLAAFGNNETAARLPSAAFALALLCLTFGFCRKVHGTRCGLLGVIVVATMPLFFVYARTVIFDMALAFFVCGAVFAGYLAEATDGKSRRNWYLLGAASAGFATLVKGPVGLLIPVLILLVFNRVEGRRGAAWRLLAPLNLAVFLGITLPWLVGLCLAHKDFLQYGLVEESFKRFTMAKRFQRSEPFYFYAQIVAGMLLPWSVLLPEAMVATWRERWAKHPADRLCLVWCLVVLVFFSLSQSKLPQYILSVTVPCGILLARLFAAALAAPEGRAARLVLRAATGFAAVCVVAATAAAAGAARWPALSRALRLPVADAERLAQAAVPLVLVSAGFAAFSLLARYRRSAFWCFLCLAIFPPLCVNLNAGLLRVVFEAKSGRRMAEQLAALPPETQIACLVCFPNGLAFYLGRTTTLISRDGRELTSNYITASLEKTAQWPRQIVPLSHLEAWLASRKAPVYLIVPQEGRAEMQRLGARDSAIQPLGTRYWGVLLAAADHH